MPRKNYVYRSMTPTQVSSEISRLSQQISYGGQKARDAIEGLLVLADIGHQKAFEELAELARSGWRHIIAAVAEPPEVEEEMA